MFYETTFAPISPIPAVLCGAIVLLALYTVVYRLHLHPLAKYPGPFWARLSSIPSYWHTLRQDRHIWHWRLQQQYGTTFRYEPNSILINTPTGFKTIFGPKGNVKKSVYYQVWPRTVESVNTWSSTEISVHGPKRRVLNHVFSHKALRSAEGFVHSNVDRWCDLIAQTITNRSTSNPPPLNMADQVNYLVFDILGDLCFGRSFNMKEADSSLRHIPHMMCQFLEILHPIAFSPFASLWVWLKSRGLDWALEVAAPASVKNWGAFVAGCLAERTDKENKYLQDLCSNPEDKGEDCPDNARKDFFHYLFHATDPVTGQRGYKLEELYGEAELLIIAGSDTTAVVIAAVIFYLVRWPDMQKKLAHEICTKFEGLDEIRSGTKLMNSCKYLRAVIQEALRMTPPVGAEPSRTVRRGGTHVEDQFFPEGVNISTGLYCLSYNPDIYPDPFRFRPDRWIVEGKESEESVARAESGSCTFSSGSRGCPGKNLAWLEMSIVIAKLVFRFEMEEDAKNKVGGGHPAKGRLGRREIDQYQTRDVFVSLRDGPMVHFKERSREQIS